MRAADAGKLSWGRGAPGGERIGGRGDAALRQRIERVTRVGDVALIPHRYAAPADQRIQNSSNGCVGRVAAGPLPCEVHAIAGLDESLQLGLLWTCERAENLKGEDGLEACQAAGERRNVSHCVPQRGQCGGSRVLAAVISKNEDVRRLCNSSAAA